MSTKEKKSTKYSSVGGQALLEGVMMQSPSGAAMAVRRQDGTIEIRRKTVTHIKDKLKFLGFPVIRGIVNMVESLLFGYKCMMESAEISGGLDEGLKEENPSKLDKWLNDHMGPKLMAVIGGISMVLGVLLSVFLFMYLPTLVVDLFDKYIVTGAASFAADGIYKLERVHPLFEGIIRMIIFICYILFAGMQKDIKRTFMYHGSEHKSIFCFEAGQELTVENVKKFKRFHPRCGTSFIFLIIIISILISSLLAVAVPNVGSNRILWVFIKLMISPLVIGLGYEFIKYAGKHDNIVTRIISAPGLWMQRLTTKEPTDDMIEVAIAALKASLENADEQELIKLRSEIADNNSMSAVEAEFHASEAEAESTNDEALEEKSTTFDYRNLPQVPDYSQGILRRNGDKNDG